MTLIRCPHCQETGCDGRCRFRLGRRGFLGLGLGALAAAVLPGPKPVWMPDDLLRPTWTYMDTARLYASANIYISHPTGTAILMQLEEARYAPRRRRKRQSV